MSSSSSGAAAAPWKQLLLTALERNSHVKHCGFFQLATVSSNGRPANRTVVFRGFLESCDKIQINTDARSNKIEDIKHCPFAEICWYFTDSWEQFRLNGTIDIIDGSNTDPVKLQQRETSWFARSLNSRYQYLTPYPGIPSIPEETAKESNDLEPSTGPVSSYCLLVFDPEQVDYLNLKSNERLIFTSKQFSDGPNGCKHWMLEKVNP